MGTIFSRKAWICASVIVDLSKKTASLMMLPAWNFDRSAVWMESPIAVSASRAVSTSTVVAASATTVCSTADAAGATRRPASMAITASVGAINRLIYPTPYSQGIL